MSREFLAFPRGEFLGVLGALVAVARGRRGVRVRAATRSTRGARSLRGRAAIRRRQTSPASIAGRMQFIAYTICGAIAGVAAICGWRVSPWRTPTSRCGFELSVIAACLIGGVAIAGGAGTAAGVVLGCLFIGIIRSSLPLVGISAFWQMFINGAVILVAVLPERTAAAVQAHHPRGARMKAASLMRWETMLAAVLVCRVRRLLDPCRPIS